MKKRKKPRFHRQRSHFYKRLYGKGWRRPRGKDSLQRRGCASRGAKPTPGYGQPRSIRGLHPSGLREVLVHNPGELKGLDASRQAARISSSVGRKKRLQIIKQAGARGIRVLNPGVGIGAGAA